MNRSPLAVISNFPFPIPMPDGKSKPHRQSIKDKRGPSVKERNQLSKKDVRFNASQGRRMENEEVRFAATISDERKQYEQQLQEEFEAQVGEAHLSSDGLEEDILEPAVEVEDEEMSHVDTDDSMLRAQEAFLAHATDYTTHQPVYLDHEALGRILLCQHPDCEFAYEL